MTRDEIIGSLGVAILLLAFVLNLTGWLHREGRLYQGLNLLGAGIACYASWLIAYYPFVVLEGAWTLVSLAALVNTFFPKRQPPGTRLNHE